MEYQICAQDQTKMNFHRELWTSGHIFFYLLCLKTLAKKVKFFMDWMDMFYLDLINKLSFSCFDIDIF